MNRRYKLELEKIPLWSELLRSILLRLGAVKPKLNFIEVKETDYKDAPYEETLITSITPFTIPPRLSKR